MLAPYAVPTLTITFLYHSAVAFLAYTNWAKGNSTSYILAFVVSAFLAAMGGWVVLFGVANGKIEKRKFRPSQIPKNTLPGSKTLP